MPMTSDAVTSGVARVATRTGGACCVAIVKTSGRLHFFFPNFKKNGNGEEEEGGGGGGGGDEETKEPARRDERRRTGATLSGCRRRFSFSPSSFIPFFLFCFLSFKYFWNKTKMHRQPLVRTFKLTHDIFDDKIRNFRHVTNWNFALISIIFLKISMKRDLIEKASKQRPLAVQLPLIFFFGRPCTCSSSAPPTSFPFQIFACFSWFVSDLFVLSLSPSLWAHTTTNLHTLHPNFQFLPSYAPAAFFFNEPQVRITLPLHPPWIGSALKLTGHVRSTSSIKQNQGQTEMTSANGESAAGASWWRICARNTRHSKKTKSKL